LLPISLGSSDYWITYLIRAMVEQLPCKQQVRSSNLFRGLYLLTK
jgi:hypothetical protein